MGNNFSRLERMVARGLSVSPGLKAWAKKSYQRVVYLRHKKPNVCETRHKLQTVGSTALESFFGYYDKSPLSPSGSHIIFQEAHGPTTEEPRGGQALNVVLADAVDGEVVSRFPSEAFNWQQGTKLQWISEDRFVFNDYDAAEDSYVARVCDATSGEIVCTLPAPVYDCFGDRFALTLNFDRLARLAPDYGYFRRMGRPCDLEALDADGVWWLDLKTGEKRLILSLAQLVALEPLESMVGASHSVNHIMIAPDGERFMVIHRWYQAGRRFDRLVVADVDGNRARVLADYGMVSHCFWVSPNRVLGYLRGADGSDGYRLLHVNAGQMEELDFPGREALGDGHPHVVGDWFVTDTYPDKARMQHLMLVNWRSGEARKLGEFFHGFEYDGQTRCDLHPRLSGDGKQVFFDSVFSGKRRLYRLEL
ncbi:MULTISPECIES: glycosyl transferase [unclassified Thioalkalivibrio]|uniref:glycosyl transferase n=1 Tax=unclassified Thioalkalivibrio TaxID=2621013 RepID=UPI001E57B669|nr:MULTISPECIES: glycosyl transferase [unclassified Thioalkalivibrio]